MGHTHRPFVRTLPDNKKIVNAGSCSLPRDTGNELCFAVFDSLNESFRNHRIPYDIDQVIQKYGNQVHPSVINCLKRNNKEAV
ncbi:MAG TPA: hypothetical protein VJL89_02165 [Thermodesulfovibrionia bacterium]|nr:hypothetical protein [Thermodesulfovibrionia bacterium]